MDPASKCAGDASFHRLISNDFGSLSQLMESAAGFLENRGLDPAAIYRVNLGREEMISNVIKYGYDEPGPRQIEVTLKMNAIEVTLVIVDDGHEFNPFSRKGRNRRAT